MHTIISSNSLKFTTIARWQGKYSYDVELLSTNVLVLEMIDYIFEQTCVQTQKNLITAS